MSEFDIASPKPLAKIPRGAGFKQNERLLFAGRDIRVVANLLEDEGDILVVTFPSAEGRPTLTKPGFGSRWLFGMGISSVSMTVDYNHWFQTPETDEALAVIAQIAKRFRRVVTYGSSMGAYGAIACSKGVGAHAALAMSPQWSIDPSRAPYDRRWMRHSTLIEERHGFVRDDLTKLANNADILIVADPWDPDATHARNIMAEVPTARWFPLPGGAHPAMSLLNEYKMVSKFVRSILRGDFTAAAWRLEIKEKRRLAQRYWLSLAKASLARGTRGRDLALRAAKHALTLAPPPDKSVRTAAQVLLDAKDFEGAAAIFAGFHDAIATSPVSMAIYAGTLLRIGNHSDAIPLIEKIAALDPANKRLPILRRNLENSMPTVSP